MTKSIFTALAIASMFACGFLSPTTAAAQDTILAETYGRGVHAYYAGRYSEAQQYLTAAIDGGLNDPRAYYFRGILANAQGRAYDAESDWEEGAKLEASGNVNVAVGRSLSRFQGSARLKLEEIRRMARLQAATGAPTRSKTRMREIEAAQAPVAATAPRPPIPASSRPISPSPVPPAADNPFADDTGLATGQPQVENDDALAEAMKNPFQDDAAAAAPAAAGAAGGADVFGDAAAAGADPFGGAGAAGDADPFGGAADAGADPFGGGGDSGGAMADPFGGSDPFGGN